MEDLLHRDNLTERERLEIVTKLYRLSQSGKIGAIWCERVEVLFLDVGTPVAPMRRRVGWREADRISRGEDWRQVLRVQGR